MIALSFAAVVYVGVALGATMIVGADTVVEQAGMALSVAAAALLGHAETE